MFVIKQAFDVPSCTQIIFQFNNSELELDGLTEKERLVLKPTATTPLAVVDAIMAIASVYQATKNNTNRSKKHG